MRLIFNEDVKNYDNSRPCYPDKLFEDIFSYSHLSKTSEVLEIGIGTGQATPPFLQKGCKVTAVELGRSLSRYVKEKFKNFGSFNVINADFMELPIAANAFDLVYCATAFHWLPQKEGFKKTLDILRPGGVLALFWNHPFPNRENDESNRINRRVYDKYRPSDKKIAEFSKNDCQKTLGALQRFGFRNTQSKLYHRKRTLSSAEYISLLNTYSDHRALPAEIKKEFETEMKRSLDKEGGKINIYDTIDLYLAAK